MTARTLAFKLEVKWDGVSWTDESSRVESATGNLTAHSNLPGGIGGSSASDMTVTLRNAGNRFSPDNASGALYAYIQSGKLYHKLIRASVSIDGAAYTRIFTGFVEDYAENHVDRTVKFQCVDQAALFETVKLNSSVYSQYTTSSLISAIAAAAGTLAGGAPGMTLDAGIMTIPHAWQDDESAWQEIALVAEAEGGRVYFDVSNGNLVFENGYHDVSNTSVAENYVVGSFKNIDQGYDFGEVYNRVVIEYAAWVQGPRTVVYTADEVWIIPAGTTGTFSVRLRSPCPVGMLYAPTYNSTDEDRSDFYAASSGGVNISGNQTVTAVLETLDGTASAQNAKVTIVNANATYDAYIQRFRLQGKPLVGSPTRRYEVKDAASITQYGERTLTIPTNQYIQDATHAQALADMLLARCKDPKKRAALPIPGNPARRPGQRVNVIEAASGANLDCFIRGVNWGYGPGGYEMDLDLIQASVFTGTPYFIVGTSKYGSGTGSGKLWY